MARAHHAYSLDTGASSRYLGGDARYRDKEKKIFAAAPERKKTGKKSFGIKVVAKFDPHFFFSLRPRLVGSEANSCSRKTI